MSDFDTFDDYDGGRRKVPLAAIGLGVVTLLIIGAVIGRQTSAASKVAPNDAPRAAPLRDEAPIEKHAPFAQMDLAPKNLRGAVIAAAIFVTDSDRISEVPDENREFLALSILAPDVEIGVRNGFISADFKAAGVTGKGVWSPTSYKTTTVDDRSVTVRMWGVVYDETLSEGTGQRWYFDDVTMTWGLGQWRVANWTRQPAPSPSVSMYDPQGATPSQLHTLLNEFTRFQGAV